MVCFVFFWQSDLFYIMELVIILINSPSIRLDLEAAQLIRSFRKVLQVRSSMEGQQTCDLLAIHSLKIYAKKLKVIRKAFITFKM